jgi:hypothetical protein
MTTMTPRTKDRPVFPKDALGHTIREGYTVLYPVTQTRDLSLKRGTIERIINQGTEDTPVWVLKVRPHAGGKLKTIRHLERVVVIVE